MFESLSDLQILWFILVGVLFAGYAILDGFDLGAGIINLFIKDDTERRLVINAVGPVWDGNEVWLITGGGALFAAFPYVYASIFSGFYLAFMLLLLALIVRAVSIEFRSKQPMIWWRKTWDFGFSLASLVAALLIGVAMGNVTIGVPLDQNGNFTGTFLGLLNPYSLDSLGLTTVALFTMHGCIYLIMKTEDALQERLKHLLKIVMPIFLILVTIHAVTTLIMVPHTLDAITKAPWIWAIVALTGLAIIAIPAFIKKDCYGWAFLASVATMGGLMGIFGATMFPDLVFSPGGNSLTVTNSASSLTSLQVMTGIAFVGVPIVLAYSAAIYWVFRGKVKLNEHSY